MFGVQRNCLGQLSFCFDCISRMLTHGSRTSNIEMNNNKLKRIWIGVSRAFVLFAAAIRIAANYCFNGCNLTVAMEIGEYNDEILLGRITLR